MECQIDGVHVLAPERSIHDGWGKRVRDRIACHAVDARRHVHSLDAIDIAQFLGGDLARGSLFAGRGGGEGEHAAGAHTQNAADDSLFAHAHANQGVPVTFLRQKLDHGDVVGEGSGRADDLVEVSRVGDHFFQRLVELLGGPEVVKRKDQSRSGAKFLELFGLALASGLEFDVNELAAGGGGLAQNV